MLRLADIEETVKKISDVIASVMNMEIIICDNHLRKIGDSNKNWESECLNITKHSILTKIINAGKHLVIKTRNENKGCMICLHKNKCNLKALIGTPIQYNDTILGSIGILADTEENKKILLEKEKYILDFINKMADLIISKLLEKEATDKLKIMKKRLLSIMDSIDDGIIALDEKGYIIYMNSHIKEFIDLFSMDLRKQNIMDLIPKVYIKEMIQDGRSFRNRELNIRKEEMDLQMIVSGKIIKHKDRSIGSILTFKKMSDIYNVVMMYR
ncbi:PAS domain-containing protein [Crassaminicella thermophila]|uniref:PAS domain-containing protein n=1 Tax=Crassaminicella thermophila TaxID=2599308 RepID=A0A5C0SAE1_CRATE|nr:PAS domain-containing protein [Crassaminicella thermophila]QEK11121.1 PAS domain-containing protein [Crassaminicella thermophila]